jgi:hypothetical protein
MLQEDITKLKAGTMTANQWRILTGVAGAGMIIFS